MSQNIDDRKKTWAGGTGNIDDRTRVKFGGTGNIDDLRRAYFGGAHGQNINDVLRAAYGAGNLDDRAWAYYNGRTLGSPTFTDINASLTNNLGPDGYSWAQGYPITVDKFGKIVVLIQVHNTGHYWSWSNDNGATWGFTASSMNFLLRGSVAYDSVNDLFHVLWAATSGSDGVIYRRYAPTRDASNNITDMVQVAGVNLQLEFGASNAFEKPVLLWLNDAVYGANGALVACWAASDASNGGVHAAVRVLSNTADDNTGSNWRTLAGSATGDTTTVVVGTRNAPVTQVATYGALVNVAALRKRGGTHVGDLYLFHQEKLTTGSVRLRRYAYNSGTGFWGAAPAASVTVGATVRAGATTIRQLWEVLSKPVEDPTSDSVYIGYACWKDNAAGDTWAVGRIDSLDAVTTADAYSCGGEFAPSLYALAGDLAYDATADRLVVAWVTTGGVGFNDGQARLYQANLTPDGAATTFFTADDVDIPLLYHDPRTGATRLNNKLFVLFRDTRNQAPPYHGWWGSIALT